MIYEFVFLLYLLSFMLIFSVFLNLSLDSHFHANSILFTQVLENPNDSLVQDSKLSKSLEIMWVERFLLGLPIGPEEKVSDILDRWVLLNNCLDWFEGLPIIWLRLHYCTVLHICQSACFPHLAFTTWFFFIMAIMFPESQSWLNNCSVHLTIWS